MPGGEPFEELAHGVVEHDRVVEIEAEQIRHQRRIARTPVNFGLVDLPALGFSSPTLRRRALQSMPSALAQLCRPPAHRGAASRPWPGRGQRAR